MFYILSTNPAIQAELQKEIDQALEGQPPTHENMHHTVTPYLNGLAYETLRLYPPVPMDNKVTLAEQTLPNGVTVPAETLMSFSPFIMGRDPQRYPDPLTVDPHRWIPFQQPSLYEFPVFQAGPRVCLGMNMALFEMKVAAAMLMQQFSFTLAEGEAEKIGFSINITLSLANGEEKGKLWLVPRLRQ